MLARQYHKIFYAKILLGIIGLIVLSIRYSGYIRDSQVSQLIFIVDMQESMDMQDILDRSGLSYTRKKVAMETLLHVVQDVDDTIQLGLIRLGYYPDYIIAPTYDRTMFDAYVTSLADAPTSPTIVYSTGQQDIRLYATYTPMATYVLLTDKTTTQQAIQTYIPHVQTIFIDPNNARADIHTREDMKSVDIPLANQSSNFGWIFVLITILGLVLL